MGCLNSEIIIRAEHRPCFANGQKALFHKWNDVSSVIPPSPMMGGHPGGTIQSTFGLVELEDGSMKEFYPGEIVFCDNLTKQYAFVVNKEGS